MVSNRISRVTQPHLAVELTASDVLSNRISRLLSNRISRVTQPHLTTFSTARCGYRWGTKVGLTSGDYKPFSKDYAVGIGSTDQQLVTRLRRGDEKTIVLSSTSTSKSFRPLVGLAKKALVQV
jgi:hypothetical protein